MTLLASRDADTEDTAETADRPSDHRRFRAHGSRTHTGTVPGIRPKGQIHYFLGSGMMMRGKTGSDAAERIAAWVEETCSPSTVDDVSVYDLSR